MKQVAIITGISGQDGSYLAEFLLEKDYKVIGIKRRTSRNDLGCSSHLENDIDVHEGDLLDMASIANVCKLAKPDEFYNLGAQSHVHTSFEQKRYTLDASGGGVLNCLEAIRSSGYHTRFYQASTSEMFGGIYKRGEPLTEDSLFHPRSPYACAKMYGYWITRCFRESYKMFCCNGILFNHETNISAYTPMIYKDCDSDEINISPLHEIVKFNESLREYQCCEVHGLQVWDGNGWTKVKAASAYPHDAIGSPKKPRLINARCGSIAATAEHVGFLANGDEIKIGDMVVGHCVKMVDLPVLNSVMVDVSVEEAEMLGMLVADGSHQNHDSRVRYTKNDPTLRKRMEYLWQLVMKGNVREWLGTSGFNSEKNVNQMDLTGVGWMAVEGLDLYNEDRTKRVPKRILNAPYGVMHAFLKGYNRGDGLKSNLCVYEFRNFKTNSPTLAMGLWYLIYNTTSQDVNLTIERNEATGQFYWSLNLLSPNDNEAKEVVVNELLSTGLSQRQIQRDTGTSRTLIRKIQNGGHVVEDHHMRKDPQEIKKIVELHEYDDWLYDLETESGTFHCGVGRCHVHNSPRRGPNFVTRKITLGAVQAMADKSFQLSLGNMEAQRDWGHAKDFVRGMWLMLQQPRPYDFVLCTGIAHTVRDFCEIAFKKAGLRYEDRVTIDPMLYRPAEVDILLGSYQKAKDMLGWEPMISFEELVEEMFESDKAAIVPKVS